jgi:glutathione peroxidase
LTPQYDALEKLYDEYGAQGFVVAGFPANDFGAQEPGSNDEIAAFCRGTFGVKFPMFEKIVVTGADKHPLYAALTSAQPAPDSPAFRAKLENYGIKTNPAPEVLWNFEKFLIDRQGNIVNRFAPNVAPDDESVVGAIEAALGKK